MKLSGARRVAEALSKRGAVPKNAFSTRDVEQVRAMKLRSLPSLVPTVASSAWTSQLPLAMAKDGYENAVIGNLDDPLALETCLEHVGATERVLLHPCWMLHLLNVGMVVVAGWRGTGRASKMVTLDFAFRSLDISHCCDNRGPMQKKVRYLSCRASLISMRCWILPKDALQVSIARIPMNSGDNIIFANSSADPFVSTLADNVMRYVSILR